MPPRPMRRLARGYARTRMGVMRITARGVCEIPHTELRLRESVLKRKQDTSEQVPPSMATIGIPIIAILAVGVRLGAQGILGRKPPNETGEATVKMPPSWKRWRFADSR